MRFKLVGNQRVSPNADVSPSQLCAVCQGRLFAHLVEKQSVTLVDFSLDSAQCQHYGVRTCEGTLIDFLLRLILPFLLLLGCKGFFKVS